MIVWALLKGADESDQDERRLFHEVTKLKEDLRTQTEKFNKVNKKLTQLSEERTNSEALLVNLTQEVEKIKESF